MHRFPMNSRWGLVFPFLVAVAAGCTDASVAAPGRRDFTPPRLSVLAPARGAIADAALVVDVRGTASDDESGIDRLTVNGAPVAVAADGSFTTRVALSPGITLIETRLVDREGNERSETRAVLSGDLVAAESTVPDGLILRLDRKLLQAASDVAARRLAALDLDALAKAKNPLVDAGAGCLRAKVVIVQVSKGAVHASLLPVDGGLALDASFDDLRFAAHVSYDLACSAGEKDVVFTARRFRLSGTFGLGLGASGAVLDASQITAAFEDFQWGGDLPASVRDFLEAPLGNGLAAFVGKELQDRLPDLVASTLRGQDRVVNLGDRKLVVALRPTVVKADPAGLYLALDTRLYLDGLPGAIFPRSRQSRPVIDSPPRALGLALADDALNGMLSSMWGAGVFNLSKDVVSQRLDEVASVFNHLELVPRLPPVAEALPGGAGLRITFADLDVALELREPGQAPKPAGRVAATLRASFTARIVDGKLTLATTAPDLRIDVLPDPAHRPPALNEDSLRALGSFLTDTLLGVLDGAVANVPLPALEGLTISDGAVTSADAAGGYLVVRGDLAAR